MRMNRSGKTGLWALATLVFLAVGVGIGVLCVLIRVVNPAFPEGMMLAILFGNLFGGQGGGRGPSGPQMGHDLEAELHLAFDDAVRAAVSDDLGGVEAILARRSGWIRSVQRDFDSGPSFEVRVPRDRDRVFP